jgi:hypothetical protein
MRFAATVLIAATFTLHAPLASHGESLQNLPKPQGPVILVITGEIANTNSPGRAEFDLAMLESLGVTALETRTPWTDQPHRYEGVLARNLLSAVGARGSVLTAIGLNDYMVDIPVSEVVKYPVLLALKRDANYLTVRRRGPIEIVYPREQAAELRTSHAARKAVGMLREIVVK